MGPKNKNPKSAKRQPEVWVAPDLMRKMKGAEGNRGAHALHSPYLMLADQFLGLESHDGAAGKAGHKSAAQSTPPRVKPPQAEPETAMRAMVAAAGAAGELEHALFSSIPPRVSYPKPPSRPAIPHPPKLAAPRPNPPKPPKTSFARRSKVDRRDRPE